MSSPQSLPPSLHIIAVAVIYKRIVTESESVSSLLRILEQQPDWSRYFSLILYDNSPEPQSIPVDLPLPVTYIHDGSNGGLAPAYNYALQQAQSSQTEWLLLLDQDTTLTPAYIAELMDLASALQAAPEIGGIVPKLTAEGTLYSPEANFLYQLRHQFRTVRHPVEETALGVQAKVLSAYNSGALLRVEALVQIGGFPADFWLDYLDHAVFAEMSRYGRKLYVMRAALEQKLSHMDVNEVPHWRHRNVLTAQTRYVIRYGRFLERMLYRLYLLRVCRFLHRCCRNRRVWKEMFFQVFVLRVPSVRIGE